MLTVKQIQQCVEGDTCNNPQCKHSGLTAGEGTSSSSAFPSYISGVHHFLGEIFAYVAVY